MAIQVNVGWIHAAEQIGEVEFAGINCLPNPDRKFARGSMTGVVYGDGLTKEQRFDSESVAQLEAI